MQCPKCKVGVLQHAYLDNIFPCRTCDRCGGNWLMLDDYLQYKSQLENLASSDESLSFEAEETKHALICPVTGTLMLKYRISKESTHRLDLSPRINAIWLDKGEWELLKKEGISDKLNSIFTDVWQRRIRESLAHNQFDTLYSTEFGQEDYEKVKSIRAWLLQHPHKDKLTAFLLADNPWSALK